MIYRRFGKTGLDISVLSAGFMRVMHSWQPVPMAEVPEKSQGNLADIVRAALEGGINHLETARAYGSSEKQLGQALQGIPRERYVLQTKVMPRANPRKFAEDVLDSLTRLQVERVDLLAIHGINDYRSLWHACREGGCLAAARRLQRQGRIGAVGFSGHGPPEVQLAAVQQEREGGFDYLNLHWYYIYQVNSPVLAAAARKDMGVFIISPTDKGGGLQDPPELFRRLCEPLSPMAFNDAYCLQRPEIQTISIGAAQPADFRDHQEALALLDSSDMVADVDRRCAAAMHKATGSVRPEELWGRFPPWDKTPGLINIPFILWLYNLGCGWGLWGYSRRRYSLLGREVEWVPGCNASSADAYDLRSIAEAAGMKSDELIHQLKEAHRLLGGQDPDRNAQGG